MDLLLLCDFELIETLKNIIKFPTHELWKMDSAVWFYKSYIQREIFSNKFIEKKKVSYT